MALEVNFVVPPGLYKSTGENWFPGATHSDPLTELRKRYNITSEMLYPEGLRDQFGYPALQEYQGQLGYVLPGDAFSEPRQGSIPQMENGRWTGRNFLPYDVYAGVQSQPASEPMGLTINGTLFPSDTTLTGTQIAEQLGLTTSPIQSDSQQAISTTPDFSDLNVPVPDPYEANMVQSAAFPTLRESSGVWLPNTNGRLIATGAGFAGTDGRWYLKSPSGENIPTPEYADSNGVVWRQTNEGGWNPTGERYVVGTGLVQISSQLPAPLAPEAIGFTPIQTGTPILDEALLSPPEESFTPSERTGPVTQLGDALTAPGPEREGTFPDETGPGIGGNVPAKTEEDIWQQRFNQWLDLAGLRPGLRGELAPDELNQIYRAGAERGVALGVPGSQNLEASILRDIGLTSRQVRREAIDAALPVYVQGLQQMGLDKRQAEDLAASMERLQLGLANQRDIANLEAQTRLQVEQMQQAGLSTRQANDIAAAFNRLTFSENAQDRRQATELAEAMKRLQLQTASARDMELLRQAGEKEQFEREAGLRTGLAQLDAATRLQLAGMAGGGGGTIGGGRTGLPSGGGPSGGGAPNQATQDLLRQLLERGRTGGGTTTDPAAELQRLFNQWSAGRATQSGRASSGDPIVDMLLDEWEAGTPVGDDIADMLLGEWQAGTPVGGDFADLEDWLAGPGGGFAPEEFGVYSEPSFYEPLSNFDMGELEDFLYAYTGGTEGAVTPEELGVYSGQGPLTVPELPGGGYGSTWDDLYQQVYGSPYVGGQIQEPGVTWDQLWQLPDDEFWAEIGI